MSDPDEVKAAVADAVASRIIRGCEEKGWSLSELARRAGVSPMLLSNAVRKKSGLSLATIVQLAQALGCSVDEFSPI